MPWILPRRGRREPGGAGGGRRGGGTSGRTADPGARRMADHVTAAISQVAGGVRAPAWTGAAGDVGSAVIGGVERDPRDDDPGVRGVGVDRDPLAGAGAAV